jgi:hypothetical protein
MANRTRLQRLEKQLARKHGISGVSEAEMAAAARRFDEAISRIAERVDAEGVTEEERGEFRQWWSRRPSDPARLNEWTREWHGR